MAHQRLTQARWQLVGSAADFMPKVSFDGAYSRSAAHKFTSSRWGTGSSYHGNRWSSGFDASWEIDLFGGTRREFEQAEALMESANYTLADAWVSLTAEIGRYIGSQPHRPIAEKRIYKHKKKTFLKICYCMLLVRVTSPNN